VWHRFTSAILRPHLIDRPAVTVVLQWKVLSPECRIIRFFGELDDAIKWISRFLFVLKDRNQQPDSQHGAETSDRGHDNKIGYRVATIKVQQTISEVHLGGN
jgi:hypothetical protein